MDSAETKQSDQRADQRAKRRVTWVGAGANLALAGVKFAAGTLGNSATLVSDAVHSLSDLITDVLVLLGVRFAARPADEEHPWGHGRIETLVGFVIGLLLIGAALLLGWRGLEGIRSPKAVEIGWLPAVAAALSLIVKEVLFRWTRAVGRRTGSTALRANAWHHRSDALSSLVALAAVTAAPLLPEWTFLDPLGSLLVSLLVLTAGVRITRDSARELIDTGVERELREKLAGHVGDVAGVHSVKRLCARHMGSNIAVDLTVNVDPEMNVFEAHRITEYIDAWLRRSQPGLGRIMIHVEPARADGELNGRRNRELRERITTAVDCVEDVLRLRGLRLYRRSDGVLVELELSLEGGSSLEAAHAVGEEVRRRVRTLKGVREVMISLRPLVATDN